MADQTQETPEEKEYFETQGQKAPEPEALETPVAEEKEADHQEQEQPQREHDTVPHSAFHEERQRRKGFQAENTKLKNDLSRLSGRMEILEQLARQTTQTPPLGPAQSEVPDWDKDPLGYTKAKVDSTEQKLSAIEKQAIQQQGFQQFHQTVTSQIGKFMEEKGKDEYSKAHNHLFTQMGNMMLAGGWPQEVVDKQIGNWVMEISAKAMQDGVNPGERIYEMAKKAGYTSRPPTEEKAAKIEKGLSASKSVSGMSASPPVKNRAEALLAMTDEEFDEATKGDKWRKLFVQ
jgi:hypothetical protein